MFYAVEWGIPFSFDTGNEYQVYKISPSGIPGHISYICSTSSGGEICENVIKNGSRFCFNIAVYWSDKPEKLKGFGENGPIYGVGCFHFFLKIMWREKSRV